jgi:hypothetical protein
LTIFSTGEFIGQNARQVISSVTTDNAIGGQNTTTYKYGNAKVNVKGRFLSNTRSSKPSPLMSINIEYSPFSCVGRFFQLPSPPRLACHCLPLSKPSPVLVFDRNPKTDQQGLFVYLNTGDGFDSGKQWQANLGGDGNWKNRPTHENGGLVI